MSKNKVLIALTVAVIALLFLWMRENEGRVAAEAQLKNLQFKATTVINEKGNAISELETQVGEAQAKMQAMREQSDEALSAKDQEMAAFKAETERKQAQYEEEIHQKDQALNSLEANLKDTTARFDGELKKKNADIADLGEQLRKTTERLAATLKKQQSLESENLNLRAGGEGLERQVQALKAEKTRLEIEAKNTQVRTAITD